MLEIYFSNRDTRSVKDSSHGRGIQKKSASRGLFRPSRIQLHPLLLCQSVVLRKSMGSHGVPSKVSRPAQNLKQNTKPLRTIKKERLFTGVGN
jgi:hypothetical protein